MNRTNEPPDSLDHVEIGWTYLGYMASPWTCVGYNPDTDEASFRFGQPGYHTTDEVVVWPRHQWRSLVRSSSNYGLSDALADSDQVIDGDSMIDAIVRVLDAEHVQCGEIGWDGRLPLARKIATKIRAIA
jgi:hypothetical protein